MWASLLTSLGKLLVALVGPSLAKVFTKLGVGFVVYEGMSGVLDNLQSYVYSTLGQLPGDIYAFMNLCGMSDIISIIGSAVTVRFTWQYGLNSGSVKKIGFNGN